MINGTTPGSAVPGLVKPSNLIARLVSIPPMSTSSLRPHREPQGVGSPIGEATVLCGRPDRLRGLEAVGNRGFSGAANAARSVRVARRVGLEPDG